MPLLELLRPPADDASSGDASCLTHRTRSIMLQHVPPKDVRGVEAPAHALVLAARHDGVRLRHLLPPWPACVAPESTTKLAESTSPTSAATEASAAATASAIAADSAASIPERPSASPVAPILGANPSL
jgi:hypothetical protein